MLFSCLPFPVPHSAKKSNSALVIGRVASFVGMQYLKVKVNEIIIMRMNRNL